MVPAGVFKVWGEVGVTGKPFPFAKVSSGFNPAPISTPPPFQTPLTRTTDGSTALLAEFTASGGIDPLGSYVIALLLAGKAPPTRPLP